MMYKIIKTRTVGFTKYNTNIIKNVSCQIMVFILYQISPHSSTQIKNIFYF